METSNQQQSLQQCEQQQQQQQSIHIQIPHHSSISQLELFEFGEIKEKVINVVFFLPFFSSK
jgi:hypothetical protein